MPIRPENRDRYPPDWPAISRWVRHDRAHGHCECDGRCGHDHRAENATGGTIPVDACTPICAARHGEPHPVTGSTVVLTVAHLDHTPEHCAPPNLMAMCQRCHLAYDADHHAETRSRTRATQKALAGETSLPGLEFHP